MRRKIIALIEVDDTAFQKNDDGPIMLLCSCS